jgi:hypothetical protein
MSILFLKFPKIFFSGTKRRENVIARERKRPKQSSDMNNDLALDCFGAPHLAMTQARSNPAQKNGP